MFWLQNECASKESALEKETLAHQTSCVQRDSTRMELNKQLNLQRDKQGLVRIIVGLGVLLLHAVCVVVGLLLIK